MERCAWTCAAAFGGGATIRLPINCRGPVTVKVKSGCGGVLDRECRRRPALLLAPARRPRPGSEACGSASMGSMMRGHLDGGTCKLAWCPLRAGAVAPRTPRAAWHAPGSPGLVQGGRRRCVRNCCVWRQTFDNASDICEFAPGHMQCRTPWLHCHKPPPFPAQGRALSVKGSCQNCLLSFSRLGPSPSPSPSPCPSPCPGP